MTSTFSPTGLDALAPPEVARKAASIGVAKAAMPMAVVFVLAVLAGAFIALGAIFATTVAAGGGELPYASSGSWPGSRSASA
jgi:formate/nitrite transporter FocA (FNT family)